MSTKINDGLTKYQRYRLRHAERLAIKRRANYAKNRDAILAAAKTNPVKKAAEVLWRKRNKEAIAKRVSAWAKANPEKARAKTARYRVRTPDAWSKQYQRDPLKYAVKSAERRARKLNATPAWANEFFIREIYDLARLRTKVTGIPWEVDHIVPLKSPVVCGLHVEHNLRVIPRSENKLKRNHHYG